MPSKHPNKSAARPSSPPHKKRQHTNSISHKLLINLNPNITQITSFRRRSHYNSCLNVYDKIDVLIKKGICIQTEYSQNKNVNTLSICKQFSMENHHTMVLDDDRLQYYKEAMRFCSSSDDGTSRCVAGKRILEIGTGPHAILAINAINAGAHSVDALEVNSDSCQHAKNTIYQYGFDRVSIHGCHSKQFSVEDKEYDMIIHEILGDFASQEGVADVMLDIQQRLKCKPQSIPFGASTVICPTMFPEPDDIKCPSNEYPERTIVSPKRKLFQSVQLNFQHLLLSDFQPFEVLKFEENMKPQMQQKRLLTFVIRRPGLMSSLLCGIDIEIRPNVFFGTRYIGQTNSWYTTLIVLPEEIEVRVDDIVEVLCVSDLTKYDEVSTGRSTNQKQKEVWTDKSTTASSSPPPSAASSPHVGGGSQLLVSRPEYSFEVCVKRRVEAHRNDKIVVTHRCVKQFKKITIPFIEQAPRVYRKT